MLTGRGHLRIRSTAPERELPAERESDRSEDYGHVLGWLSGFVAADMAVTGVNVALPGGDDGGRTGRVIDLVEGDLSFWSTVMNTGPGCVCHPVELPGA